MATIPFLILFPPYEQPQPELVASPLTYLTGQAVAQSTVSGPNMIGAICRIQDRGQMIEWQDFANYPHS